MQRTGRICVVTGERGSGKSTVCARVAEGAATKGFTVAGILTERVEEGQDSYRRVIDLSTAETRRFGSQHAGDSRGNDQGHPREGAGGDAAGGPVVSDPLTPGWTYGSEVFAWADEVFSRPIRCDLFVVDEVGPLELLGGRGWVKALDALASAAFRLAVVVCRPGLLDELQQRLGRIPVTLLEVTPQTRAGLPAVILDELSACRPFRREDAD